MQKKLLLVFIIFLSVCGKAQNVGIGTITPNAKLNVLDSSNSPSIPGNSISTGILRLSVSNNEGIDIGKMSTAPYAGWIQSGYNGSISDPISLQPVGGNVGIGTTMPNAKLEVAGGVKISDSINIGGQIRITSGSPGVGKILTSDANGLASWVAQTPSAEHFIGESFGGGIVFYITPNGMHGLVADTIQFTETWYLAQNAISNPSNHSTLGKNYTDWRLPTKLELQTLYLARPAMAALDYPSDLYWSSTEYDSDAAYYFVLGNGNIFGTAKSSTLWVIPVRSF